MDYLSLGMQEVAKGKRGEKTFANHLRNVVYPNSNEVVWNNPSNFKGVDIVVTRNDVPIHVFEVTNYNKKNWFSKRRAQRYINSLNEWKKYYPNIERAVVISYPETVDTIKGIRKMFQDEGIEIWTFKETP